MKQVFVVADNIFSPLGYTSVANYTAVKAGASGIRQIFNTEILSEPFFAAMFESFSDTPFTRFEQACVQSISNALSTTSISLQDKDTIFILSTTKGNIELLEQNPLDANLSSRIAIHNTACKIANQFKASATPIAISNACISGVLAIVTAQRLLKTGRYKHAVVTGADMLSKFVISGFQALGAMSTKRCRPFDKERDGINLGECAATVILSTDASIADIEIKEGAISNDANHISGPSRTGVELAFAIEQSMKKSNINITELSFVSAHGTATIFNDEMEAKAFNSAGISSIPTQSLKPHFGHTLGAAGVLETIISIHALREGIVLPSLNFNTLGVSEPIEVASSLSTSTKKAALKTASGFGGCNAAMVLEKI